MFPRDTLGSATRRAVMKAAAGALGVAALGARVGAHNKFGGGVSTTNRLRRKANGAVEETTVLEVDTS